MKDENSMPGNEDIEALTGLGLSVLQAKVYLALSELGSATIKSIAKTANVARQDMYRLISELQAMGVVEKIISFPNQFRALPMRESIDILLQRRRKENSEAYAKAMLLIQRHKTKGLSNHSLDNVQFVLIPEKEALITRLRKSIETAERSVGTICSWQRFSPGVEILSEAIEKALRKGVEIRTIIEEPAENESISRTLRAFTEHPKFKLRVCREPTTSIMGIFDGNEMLLSTSVEGKTAESPALWTNNHSLLMVSLNYFESSWSKSIQINRGDTFEPSKTEKKDSKNF
jgi:sugar-specific transcriptional regulator TrmB